MEFYLHASLAGNEWLASRSGRCIPEERAPLLKGRQGGNQIRSRGFAIEKNLSSFPVTNKVSYFVQPAA
jgi:hypothetical protein